MFLQCHDGNLVNINFITEIAFDGSALRCTYNTKSDKWTKVLSNGTVAINMAKGLAELLKKNSETTDPLQSFLFIPLENKTFMFLDMEKIVMTMYEISPKGYTVSFVDIYGYKHFFIEKTVAKDDLKESLKSTMSKLHKLMTLHILHL